MQTTPIRHSRHRSSRGICYGRERGIREDDMGGYDQSTLSVALTRNKYTK